jgi:hypothetical protein
MVVDLEVKANAEEDLVDLVKLEVVVGAQRWANSDGGTALALYTKKFYTEIGAGDVVVNEGN